LDAGGTVTFELGIPRVNITAQGDSNVDDICNPSSSGKTKKYAINLMGDVEARVYAMGELDISSKLISKTWDSDEFSLYTYPIYNNYQCLYAGKLKAKFLDEVRSSKGLRTRRETPQLTVLCVLVATVLCSDLL
jgi:hypothetical protein